MKLKIKNMKMKNMLFLKSVMTYGCVVLVNMIGDYSKLFIALSFNELILIKFNWGRKIKPQ